MLNPQIIIQNPNQPQTLEVNGDILEILPLGAGSEVGRSCLLVTFKNKKIMLDCGIHPAYTGINSLPYFDEIDPSTIDLLLVTHFHLDHCGALPYFLEKTFFKGDCYMTPPTFANYKLILADYIKISHVNIEESLFEEKDLKKSLKKIKLIDYHQEKKINGIRFEAFNAGHVLGSAMFLVEISGVKILYTGDYSRELERHLNPAEVPKEDINILIVESTYGKHENPSRIEREYNFTKFVDEIVSKGGKCLLPVFATGRVQELLLIIDEYWELNPRLQNIKIYYASSLATNSFEIFKNFVNMAGKYIKNKLDKEGKNPFDFKHIECVKSVDNLDETKPVVVFASPGFMQSGLSKTLFEKWCNDDKNGICITGYCVDGTLARFLLGSPTEVKLTNGKTESMKMKISNVTFSAHSDFKHTNEFIQILKPKNIIFVHGEGKEMENLRTEYERLKKEDELFKSFAPKLFNPKNCQKLLFTFKTQKQGYIVGNLSNEIVDYESALASQHHYISNNNNDNKEKMDLEENIEDDNFIEVSGVLLEEENIFVAQQDLNKYSNLDTIKFKQLLTVKFTLCKDMLINILYDNFNDVNKIDNNKYIISNAITLYIQDNQIVLEWYSNQYNDFMANSLALTISQLENSPNGLMYQHYQNNKNICEYKKLKLFNFLQTKYSIVNWVNDNDIEIIEDNVKCTIINLNHIICEDDDLKNQINNDLLFFNSL